MGIFDKLFKSNDNATQQIEFSTQEAYLGVMMAAAGVDGHISPEEGQAVSTMLNRTPMFRNVPERQMQGYVQKIVSILNSSGPGTIMNAATQVLNPDQKETVFTLTVDLVLADGRVDGKEKEFLDALQNALGIGDDLATMVAQVMMIKNRG